MKISFHNKLQRYYGSSSYTFGLGFGLTKSAMFHGAVERELVVIHSLEFIFGPFVMTITWGKEE
jgi:hypothetical protein